MEPISTFVSLVGLLGLFKSERQANQQATLDGFTDWLRRHEHEQMVNMVLHNADLARSISGLLESQHEQVTASLASMEQMMIDIAGRLDKFSPVVQALQLQSRLSEQALSILCQLYQCRAGSMMEINIEAEGKKLFLGDGGTTHPVNIPDPRFLKDDLYQLLNYGLLLADRGAFNEPLFRITRAGAHVASNMH